jgi:hypothetical protein
VWAAAGGWREEGGVTWAKLDDHFPDHPKVMRAGPDAGWLHVCVICYCARHHTDGFIPKEAVATVSTLREPDCLAARLVEVGLWHDRGSDYEVHDFLTYNPSREQVFAEREKAKERRATQGQRGGRRSGDVRATEPRENEAPTRPDVPTEHSGVRKTRPPADFAIDDALRAWADEKHPGVDVDRERDKWLLWCVAEGKTYKDHRAGFQTWVGRAKPTPPAFTPAPAIEKNGERYVGPVPLPKCSGCGRLVVDCTCGVIVHDFRKATV